MQHRNDSGIKVTLVRSQIGIKPKQRGTLARARPAADRIDEHVARPARSARHDRARAAPHQGGGALVKIHDLKPAPGSRRPKQRVGARHRRQGRQDRRPRQQGSGRARQRPRPVRRWPDAAAPPDPEGQGLQQPVPGRVPRRQPVDSRRIRRRRRGHPGHAARRAVWSPSGAWSRCWPGARSPSR